MENEGLLETDVVWRHVASPNEEDDLGSGHELVSDFS